MPAEIRSSWRLYRSFDSNLIMYILLSSLTRDWRTSGMRVEVLVGSSETVTYPFCELQDDELIRFFHPSRSVLSVRDASACKFRHVLVSLGYSGSECDGWLPEVPSAHHLFYIV